MHSVRSYSRGISLGRLASGWIHPLYHLLSSSSPRLSLSRHGIFNPQSLQFFTRSSLLQAYGDCALQVNVNTVSFLVAVSAVTLSKIAILGWKKWDLILRPVYFSPRRLE